jgi:hypothetical protein
MTNNEEIRKKVLEETRNKMCIDDYMLENDIIYNAMVNAIDLTIALMKSSQEKEQEHDTLLMASSVHTYLQEIHDLQSELRGTKELVEQLITENKKLLDLQKKEYISVEEHNKVIDKTKELIRQEQEDVEGED